MFWRLLPRSPTGQAGGKVIRSARTLLAGGSSRGTLLAVPGVSTAVSMAEPFLPLRLHHNLNVSAGAIGLLLGLMMMAFAVASPLATALGNRIGLARLMAAGLAGMAALMPILALASSVSAESCALAGLGICLALVLTPALTVLGGVVDATGASHGMTYALFNIVYAGGMLLGPVEGGRSPRASASQPPSRLRACCASFRSPPTAAAFSAGEGSRRRVQFTPVLHP